MSIRDPGMGAQLLWKPEPPHADEGLLSFVSRCAADQFLSSQHSIMRAAGQVHANRPTARLNGDLNIDQLASCLMIDPAEVERRNYKLLGHGLQLSFFGATIPRWHVLSSTRQFSPASLRQAPYGRGGWEHGLIPFCPQSWEYLTDRCPERSCRAVQGWRHATGIENCDRCMAPLTNGARRSIPERWRSTLSFVAGLVSSCPAMAAAAEARLPTAIQDLNRGEAFVLMLALFPLNGHLPMTNRTATWWRKRPFRLTAALVQSGAMLLNWPVDVIKQITENIGERTGRSSNTLHHAASTFFKAKWADPESLTAKAVGILSSSLQAVGVGRVACSKDSVSITAASLRLGTGTARIAHARRVGALKTSLMLRKAEIVPAFCRREIDSLEALLAQRLSPWRCATMIGVPGYAVEHLAELEELAHEDHAYLAIRHPRWPYLDQRKAQQYVSSLLAGASEVSSIGNPIPLTDVMKRTGGRLKPWATALAAFRSNSIIYGLLPGTAPLTERVVVSRQGRSEIMKLSSPGHLLPDGSPRMLSRSDALEVLNQNCKQSSALGQYEDMTCARGNLTLPSTTIGRLASRVISASEIEVRFGVSGISLTRFFRLVALSA